MDEQVPDTSLPVQGVSYQGNIYIEIESLATYLNDVAALWADQVVMGSAGPLAIYDALRVWEMEWELTPPRPLVSPQEQLRAALRALYGNPDE